MYMKEEIREIIAESGAVTASDIVDCISCPYGKVCNNIGLPTCFETLQLCNSEYIKSLEREETNMAINTVQINPQGEIEGLDELSLADLAKLSVAAGEALDKRRDAEEERLWSNVVEAVKAYTEMCGDITVLLDNDEGVEFSHRQMTVRGEIDCQ